MYEFVHLSHKNVRIGTNVIIYVVIRTSQFVYKNHTNWYKRHKMYEFILVTLYTKISEKKDLHPVGISTRDQYPRLKSSRSAIHLPTPPSVAIFFIYRRIRKMNTIRKMRYIQIHSANL
jgi:membrane protein CcdC involved in cytochrome C biogenesis